MAAEAAVARLGRAAPLLVLIGTSASGKSTLARRLHRQGVIHLTPSWTTRPRRADERQGSLEHRFVTDTEFDRLAGEGFFIEAVEMFDLPYRYGLPPVQDPGGGRVPAVMLRAELVGLVAKHYAHAVVYQIEDSRERVHDRLHRRDQDQLGSRLDRYETERSSGRRIAARTFVNSASVDLLAERVKGALLQDFPGYQRSPTLDCEVNAR